MNKVNILEQAIGKPVEEWTLDDLQNAKGDYTDVYTDETIEEIIKRSSDDISEIFRCVRVSKVYRESCDKLENAIGGNSEDDVNKLIDFVKTDLVASDNVWDKFVGYWALSDFLSPYNVSIDQTDVKETVNVIINTAHAIHPEPGFEIIMDVVDASNTIAQHVYETYDINILEECPIMDELLEKLNLATANMYDVLSKNITIDEDFGENDE